MHISKKKFTLNVQYVSYSSSLNLTSLTKALQPPDRRRTPGCHKFQEAGVFLLHVTHNFKPKYLFLSLFSF